uniref:Uncharacterized protein n=1 Tax=Haptolina ericina TaxID=156174 RepID=A0A7S3FCY5_9EUKA
MYIPNSADRQEEDLSQISARAMKLLKNFHVRDPQSGVDLMGIWRDNFRKWMCVVLFQPLIKLMETSDRMIESEAAKGLPTATGSAGFCASSTSSLFNNPFSCSSSSKLTTQPPVSATGQKVSPGQWLEHNHSDIKAKGLVHQHRKLQRFLDLPGYPPQSKPYVRKRLGVFGQGHCVSAFKWDRSSSASSEEAWGPVPTDAEIVLHVFVCFFDVVLPPPPFGSAAPAVAGQPGMGAFSGSASLFGGGVGSGLASKSAMNIPPSNSDDPKTNAFWRTSNESCAFSSRRLARASDEQVRKSDAVIMQHVGTKKSIGGTCPRYALLCDGCEWIVSQGEHNVWECLVLFLLHRAKKGGVLDGVDLQEEIFTSFMSAMTTDAVVAVAGEVKADNEVAYHSLLSVLHPWSQQLQDVDLMEAHKL